MSIMSDRMRHILELVQHCSLLELKQLRQTVEFQVEQMERLQSGPQVARIPIEESMKAIGDYLPELVPPSGPTLPPSPMDENDPVGFGPNDIQSK